MLQLLLPLQRRNRHLLGLPCRRLLSQYSAVHRNQTESDLGDSVSRCLETLQQANCPRNASLVQLYIGSGIGIPFEKVIDQVNAALKPQTLIGCAVHAVKDPRSPGGSSAGVALMVSDLQNTKVVPFSYLPRSFHRIQVGRNTTAAREAESDFEYKDFASVSLSPVRIPLPKNLTELQGSKAQPSFLLMGDKNVEPFLMALDSQFPTSLKFGVIGTSTPFINGKPHSLFLGGDCYPHGVVGVALVGSEASSYGQVVADGTPIGAEMKVTKSRGNIVLEVDNGQNPTQRLLDGIKARGTPARKDEHFFLSVASLPEARQNSLVHRITSGDPKKGMISVDTIRDIPEGSTIQYMDTRIIPAAEQGRARSGAGIQVTVLSEEDLSAKTTPGNECAAFELQTENGFICSTHRVRASNIHKLPGSALCFEVAEISRK